MLRSHTSNLALAAVLPALVCGAFWWHAWPHAKGWFPAPLDDVYIHFDFARSLALGGALEWIPGQGYSSGETSPLYAFVLALGFLVGLRGKLLGLFAALVAVGSLASLVRSVHRLVAPSPWWLAWGLAAIPFSVPLVDWTLASGMEVALFVAVCGRALLALERARAPMHRREGMTREAAQWRLGLWGALLVLARPEAVALVAVLAIVAARGAGSRSGFLALARVAVPGAVVVALVLGANFVGTGDPQSAGARLKLLSSNPYLSDVARARIFVENLVVFVWKAMRAELSAVPSLAFAVPVVALAGLHPRAPARASSAACIFGGLAWIFLASWNANSPHHNFRYYVPAIVLFLIAAAIAIAFVARSFGKAGRFAGTGLVALVLASPAARFESQIDHYARSVSNIRDQHVEMGLRLARSTSPNARVLVGDAGAMPFVSSRSAIDALGLGGFKRLPFTLAAIHGEASTIELIERLSPSERPTHLALYPNWFAVTTSRFGHEIDRVTVERNTIAGGPTKVLYRADWATLEDGVGPHPEAIDEIDVADVVSERDHEYAPPLPHGGWTTLDVLRDRTGARRFDGGRILPGGTVESFTVKTSAPHARVIVRVDPNATDIVVTHERTGAAMALSLVPAVEGTWREGFVVIDDLRAGDRLTIGSSREMRSYHVYVDARALDARE